MNGLSVKKKLLFAFGGLLGIMIALGIYAAVALDQVNDKAVQINKTWVPSITANSEMLDAVNAHKVALYRHVTSSESAEMSKNDAALKTADSLMQEAIAKYTNIANTAVYSSEEARKKDLAEIQKIAAAWNTINNDAQEVVQLSRQHKMPEALKAMDAKAPALAKLEKETLRPMIEFNVEGVQRLSAEAEAVHQRAVLILAVAIIISILLGLAITIILTKNIMAAINELMRIFKEGASGNLKERAVTKSNDELGLLVTSYNKLLDGTAELIKKIQGTAEQVAAASEQLTASAEQSAEVTQQIATSITNVSELSSNEVNAVNNATNAIENISAGVEQTAASISLSAEGTKRAVTTSKNGQATIESAVAQMNNIEKTVNHSALVVSKLGERSKEIGQIVDTIAGIAGQTNLLALNAAIEAARAGDQGKGFAVVAEEVRKLAEQSQDAAKQIGELITGIQIDTDEAVLAMNEGTKEVKTGAEAVNKAGIAFSEILEMINEVNHSSLEIAATMEELAKGTTDIVNSVHEIDNSCKNVAGESQTVSAATEEQSAAMQEIASGSRSLAILAQNLQEASGKFRV